MKSKNTKDNKLRNKYYFIVAAVAVVLLSLIAYFYFNSRNTISNITTSKEPSAQSDFNSGGKKDIIQSNKSEGFLTDNNGSVTSVPARSEWLSSTSGKISVYSPLKNTALKSGQALSGESTVDRVSFRLIDSVSGVIAQGSLGVVNGKYSGNFDFTTSAKEGRLDVFLVNSDGIESETIEIPVRF
ncbi:hypothetical protein HGB25_02750 [Candidatus Saccharibacteria bacterium]|nr:hypothetical protein [Candidatus Saccharibacteria bacterium]